MPTFDDPLLGSVQLDTNGSDGSSLTGDPSIDAPRILQVTSQGEVTVSTSIATVELGIQVQAPTAAEVQAELAQSAASVVDVLENLDVQDLETTSIQLNPVFSFENDTQSIVGFEGRNTLQFELPTDEAGAAIDAAIEAGANLVESISFSASDATLQEARLQALNEAVEDAQTQAETVLDALGLVPGEIVGIEILSVNEIEPIPLLDVSERFDATTPILGGDQTVEAAVALNILYFPASDSTNAANV